jgi:hypothetical protein
MLKRSIAVWVVLASSWLCAVQSATGQVADPRLFDAVRAGDAPLVEELLKSGANPTMWDLLEAVEQNRLDIAHRLLRAGANPNDFFQRCPPPSKRAMPTWYDFY